jgi:hypothetical protein
LDKNSSEKIEHEISRIDKLLTDAKPLLDLCKEKYQTGNSRLAPGLLF